MLSSALRACWTSHVNSSQRETNLSPNEKRRQLLVVFQSKEASSFVDETPGLGSSPDSHKTRTERWAKRYPVVFSSFYGFLTLFRSKLTLQIRSPSPHVNVISGIWPRKGTSQPDWGERKQTMLWWNWKNPKFTYTVLVLNNKQMSLFTPFFFYSRLPAT